METTLTVVFTPTASVQLIVEEIAPGFYILLDNDVETLTPSYLGLKYNSVIIAKKLTDGMLEFMGVKFWINTRRRSTQGEDSCETIPGCLSIIPNFYIAVFMAHKVAKILCTIVLAGFIPTLTGTVKLVSLTKSGQNMLLDGKEVNIAVYGVMFFLVMFPLVVLVLGGLLN